MNSFSILVLTVYQIFFSVSFAVFFVSAAVYLIHEMCGLYIALDERR